jgi:putative membrane protein
MKKILLTGLVIGSQLLGSSLIAEAKGPDVAEKKLVCDIAQDGMAEVKVGRLAEKKGSAAEVKNFAKRMVEDHTKANDELKLAAKEDGVTLPADVNAEQKSTYDELSKLAGKAFDDKYMAEMVKGHDKAVAAIGKESETGSGHLKEWAGKTIGTIKEHDKLAKHVDSDVTK